VLPGASPAGRVLLARTSRAIGLALTTVLAACGGRQVEKADVAEWRCHDLGEVLRDLDRDTQDRAAAVFQEDQRPHPNDEEEAFTQPIFLEPAVFGEANVLEELEARLAVAESGWVFRFEAEADQLCGIAKGEDHAKAADVAKMYRSLREGYLQKAREWDRRHPGVAPPKDELEHRPPLRRPHK
jgi:hypothetical protein